MKLKTLAMAGAALAMLSGATANAGVVDKPTFKVGGLVVVWGATSAGNDNVVSDFYLLDGTNSTDLIGGADVDGTADAVVTGDLLSITDATTAVSFTDNADAGVLNAADVLSTFGLDADTDVTAGGGTALQGQFFVASNTAFTIKADVSNVANTFVADTSGDRPTLADVAFEMNMDQTGTVNGLSYGANAQLPGTAADFTSYASLEALDTAADPVVFSGTQRTAATPGNLAAQSVRFTTLYTLDTDATEAGTQGFDLADGTGELSAEVTYTIYNP